MIDRPRKIPSYALYGEALAHSPQAFAHIETIAARSGPLDWEIAPHRHAHLIQALLVQDGHAAISREGTDLTLPAPLAVIVPAGMVHGFRFRAGTTGAVLTLGRDFAVRAVAPGDPLAPALAHGVAGGLDPAIMPPCQMLAEAMLDTQRGRHTAREPGAEPLFLALAEALLRLVVKGLATAAPAPATDQRLARLVDLIEAHHRDHHPVAWYAAALKLTPRTLARLTAAQLGCTPADLLHQRLIAESRRMLRYTNATVAQIAAELGFADASYFSRFYLRLTGVRPASDRRIDRIGT